MTDTIVASSPRTGVPVAYRRSLQDALEMIFDFQEMKTVWHPMGM